MGDPALKNQLRRSIMRATILMPPLYIGKAKNLNVRCGQHLRGGSASQFHDRFEQYAGVVGSYYKKISDLLFVCIGTTESEQTHDQQGLEAVIEDIMKCVGKPPYSFS